MRTLRLLLLALLTAAPLVAQPASGDFVDERGAGLALMLANDGFGIGVFARGPLATDLSWTVGLSGRPGKDEREQQFFVGLFGETVIPFKRHYFLMLPLEVGLERRLFSRQIRPTFRPFVHFSAGPTLGYQWPYFDDQNGDGINTDEPTLGPFEQIGRGDFRFGIGGQAHFGAYIDTSADSALGFRFGYAAAYFFEEVELLEADPRVDEPNRHVFGTPVLGVQFVRRFGPR